MVGVSIPASGIVGERGSPWQLPNGNCFLIASSSLHTGAVCAKRKLQSVGAKRPKPFLPVTGRFAPPSLGYKSRRAGLLFFHSKMKRHAKELQDKVSIPASGIVGEQVRLKQFRQSRNCKAWALAP
jgi:hypothetical protein